MSPSASERWVDRALTDRPHPELQAGRCPLGHSAAGVEASRGFDYEYHTLRNELRGVRCPECGVWYLDPRPGEEHFPLIYPDDYSAYEMSDGSGQARGLAFRAKSLLERLKIRQYARFIDGLEGDILDVGCGDGQLLEGFQKSGFSREEMVGIDFHPTATRLCRGKGYRVLEGLFEHVDPGLDRYRLVVMNQLIEHMVDPLSALKKLTRILVPGGVAFIETPDTACLNARLAPKRYWGGYHYPRHLHLFDPRSMTQALELAGLEVVQIRHVPCPIPWITTAQAWLQERRKPPAALLRAVDWRNPMLLAFFTACDLLLLGLGTSNMQIVARRPVDRGPAIAPH